MQTSVTTGIGITAAARSLKVSESYLRLLANLGRMPCTRDANNRRLFSPADLRAFQKRRRRRPTAKQSRRVAA
jgi:DNA-binding transcriptional MerR regulator